MASTPTLTARIALTGGPEIQAQLAALGKAGEAAFAQLKVAAEVSSSGFGARFSAAIAETRARLVEFAAVGTELRKGIAETSKAMNEFGTAFYEVGKKALEFGLIIGGLEFGLGKLEKSAADNAEQIKKSAAALGLSTDAYQKLQFAAGKAGLEQDAFATGLTRINKIMEQAKGTIDEVKNSFTGAVTVYEKIGQELGDSQEPIIKATRVFKDLGITVTLGAKYLDQYSAAEQKVIGAQLGLAKSGQEVGDITGKTVADFHKLGVTGKDAGEVLLSLFDKLNGISNAQERLALETEFFGKGLSSINWDSFVRGGRAGAVAAGQLAESLHIIRSAAEIEVGEKARSAFFVLDQVVSAVKDHIGLALAPAFAQFAAKLSEFLGENSAALTAWANDIATKALPLIKDLFNALSGNDKAVQNKGILQFRDEVVAFAIGIRQAITGVIAAFRTLGAAIDAVLAPFNALFSTQITAGVILATVALAQFLGIFGLLIAAVPLLGIAFSTVAAVIATIFTPGGLIAAGIGALAALIIAFWPQIQAGAEALWADLVAGFNSVVAGIEGLFQGLLTFIGNVVNTVGAWINTLISDAQALVNTIGAAVSGNLTSPTAQADGGYISGAGGPRSDSILARLSNGEFVMSARAVQHWGVGMMAAINSLQGFSFGGLVDGFNASFAMPRFAGGGLAVAGGGGLSGTPVHLHLPGGHTVHLAGSANAVGQLVRYANRSNVLRAGKSPFWAGR